MSRDEIRRLKKLVASAHSRAEGASHGEAGRNAALTLLQHSMERGHHRLAVLRIVSAVEVGALPDERAWAYCQTATSEMADPELSKRFFRAMGAALMLRAGRGVSNGDLGPNAIH